VELRGGIRKVVGSGEGRHRRYKDSPPLHRSRPDQGRKRALSLDLRRATKLIQLSGGGAYVSKPVGVRSARLAFEEENSLAAQDRAQQDTNKLPDSCK
jgi:hypothetical protein